MAIVEELEHEVDTWKRKTEIAMEMYESEKRFSAEKLRDIKDLQAQLTDGVRVSETVAQKNEEVKRLREEVETQRKQLWSFKHEDIRKDEMYGLRLYLHGPGLGGDRSTCVEYGVERVTVSRDERPHAVSVYLTEGGERVIKDRYEGSTEQSFNAREASRLRDELREARNRIKELES